MRTAAATLIKALLIAAALLTLANFFDLPIVREASGGAAAAFEAQQTSPSLEVVLDRTRAYLRTYSEAYSATVATELYTQHALPARRVELESEFAMVRVPGSAEWLGLRDVLRVDGRDVTRRAGRLADLFANPAGLSLVAAASIARESARFNVGRVRRTVNNPAMVLEILDPRHHPRFRFERNGEEGIADIRASVIRVTERTRPTIVRSSGGDDEPVDGRLWIDPDHGTLLRAALRIRISDATAESLHLDVAFEFEGALQMWVPVRMRELYEIRGRHEQTGDARYVGYRQFVVQSRILPPE
jgi:hypothetical protein